MKFGSSRLASRFRTDSGLAIAVNSDHVVADFWVKNLAIGPHEEHAGVLQRHMAVDAVRRNLVAELKIFTALFDFMTGQTVWRERGRIALCDVHVVTSGASQRCGGLETFTLAQHLDLIAVHIDGVLGADVGNIYVIAEIVARYERCFGSA